MPNRDFKEYHSSIAKEIQVTKNRIRNLIGDRHWLTDGEHKEAVLRKILRVHLPESMQVGKGFVCCPEDTTNQIDILIAPRNKPTLFKDGELMLITPDSAEALIEVKTSLSKSKLEKTVRKLADNSARIRSTGNRECKAGLFVFNKPNVTAETILSFLHRSSNGDPDRVINWISLGSSCFVRFWDNGRQQVRSPVDGPVWHSYELKGLAQAYFVSNVVWDVTGGMPREMQFAWFPIPEGKERMRHWYVPLYRGQPTRFQIGG